ncbi:hypothetical protein SAMN04515667_2459 [Formosa sp. Hel1_31_208]|uniref:hypothetical protein n=1 Tax=Formosa sp. Hel1_31_208 TaxID=1798225 RepID=UPI00087A7622|nr:hypothetical protein [Formosa sp. Hel1_31_208]SDS56391.1 hypothetical protein SAMN04515667_2459 [Formosa sp. Hel1_31_208]
MITFLQAAAEKGQKITEGLKDTEKTVDDPKIFHDIINLLDVIIWPIALIIGLYMFKDHIGRVIKSLGSIKAGASGFEMNFMENKLEEATKLIGIGSSGIISKDGGSIIPKDGRGIIPKDGSGMIPKDGSDITPKSEEYKTSKRSNAESPYQELMELQDAINQKLSDIATQKGIQNTVGHSNFALTSDLSNLGIIDKHTSSKLKTLIELNTLGLNSPEITHEQVFQMKRLFNNISF